MKPNKCPRLVPAEKPPATKTVASLVGAIRDARRNCNAARNQLQQLENEIVDAAAQLLWLLKRPHESPLEPDKDRSYMQGARDQVRACCRDLQCEPEGVLAALEPFHNKLYVRIVHYIVKRSSASPPSPPHEEHKE